jgi:hypothetical protein
MTKEFLITGTRLTCPWNLQDKQICADTDVRKCGYINTMKLSTLIVVLTYFLFCKKFTKTY